MRKYQIFAATITLAFVSTVPAGAVSLTTSQKAEIEQQLEQAGKRLNLTSQQKSQVIPIMRANMKTSAGILKRYGISQGEKPNLSLRQKLSLRSELTKQRKATNAKLARILSGTQMKTLKKMQEENRARMRQRIQG